MTTSLNRLKILLPAAILLLAASSQWYRFQAGRWELATGAGERRAAALLRQTVEAAALLERLAPELTPAPGAAAEPPRMVLFSSGRDFAPFRRGSGHSGLLIWTGSRSLMLLADAGAETVRAARHELVHWMLRRRPLSPPRWLEEGLADYYSTLEFDGRSARLGRSPRGHMELLRSRAWMTAAALGRVGRADSESAAETPELFYPQSWALVRWMMIEGGGATRVAELLERMDRGLSQEAAIQEVFGISLDEVTARANRMAERIPADAAPDVRPAPAPALPGEVQRTALPDPAPAILRAECLLAAGLHQEAERLAADILRRYPKDAGAHTLAGMLALRRREFAQAWSQLEQAIALGDDSARVHFEYAMLVRDTGGPDALVEQGLRHAVASAPGFAEAWLVLGNWLLGKGRAAEAAEALERAAALEPQRSVAWEALGRARLALGDRERGRLAAARAALTAARPEETQMAQALLREIETSPAAPPKLQPGVETPAGWKPREGDAQVSGRLVEIDCSGPTLRFRIEVKTRTARTPAESVILETDKPNLVMLRGKTAGRREFVCGPQQPTPEVTAGYISAPGPATAAPQEAPPSAPPAPAAPKKSAGTRSSKKTPARTAPRSRPAAPKPQPAAGELVWLEFR